MSQPESANFQDIRVFSSKCGWCYFGAVLCHDVLYADEKIGPEENRGEYNIETNDIPNRTKIVPWDSVHCVEWHQIVKLTLIG